MITVTVIKSPKSECKSCHEAHRVVQEAVAGFPNQAQIEVIINGTPESQSYGVFSTPLVAINKKVYSMGKPVTTERVTEWIRKELKA